jgi:tartrate-resistant acid phosphatase type 5
VSRAARRPPAAAAPLALLAAQLLVAAGCAACADASYTVRRGAALSPAPAPTEAATAAPVRVLHVADFGEVNGQQAAVAAALGAAHRRAPFTLAVFPGDNLYPCGPDAARPGVERCTFGPDRNAVAAPPAGADPTFQRQHEVPLAALSDPSPPVYLALGNHDVATWPGCGVAGLDDAEVARRRACASVAHQGPRWSMPARHYLVDQGPARFIFIDSNVIYADYAGFTLEDELRFVAEAARACAARICFLVGHHPPATAGLHLRDFGRPERGERMSRVLAAAAGVRAWLAGHDHDLQHLRTAGGLDVLISGNGCCARPTERFERTSDGGPLLFASVRPGLGILTVHPGGWGYRFEDVAGRPLHCCAASGAGKCEPVACRP